MLITVACVTCSGVLLCACQRFGDKNSNDQHDIIVYVISLGGHTFVASQQTSEFTNLSMVLHTGLPQDGEMLVVDAKVK